MKTISKFFLCLLVTVAISFNLNAQQQYKFETIPGDPLNARIYTLKNGLKVYMTVYKNEPRIQTYIAVKTGSKNDPSDCTGLSHYLEHLMFKGTQNFGTLDYNKEKPYLDKIDSLYDVHKMTRDTNKRKYLYHVIDSVSLVASKYAIANEYDKIVASFGAKGTNANTSNERTVYVNDIPSNQLSKWLDLEAERFTDPVFRLFHTELEAVYEEKNMMLDRDGSKAWETLMANLFKKHTYGTQTTIGTVEHLKSPSITRIKEYFKLQYRPNNIAIILSGDFDPDKTIKMIDEKFGKLEAGKIPEFNPPVEDPIKQPIVKEVYGPDAENLIMGFRFGGASTKDADLMTMTDMILANGHAGLIDLNITQGQKALSASSSTYILKDYSVHLLSGRPKEGQTLEQLRDLLLSQIELIKKGEFQDWLIPAIINDLKLQEIKQQEANSSRAGMLLNAFTLDIPWGNAIDKINRLSKISKQDIIDFVNKNYHDNYVIIYKKNGKDNNIVKITKPHITPVTLNRTDQSDFLKKIVNTKAPDIEPVFVDYNKEINKFSIKNGIKVNYKKNDENQLFNLYYSFKMGSNNNKKLSLALDYLDYLGTSKYTSAQIKEEFYKIGCSFGVSCSEDETKVTINGLGENIGKAVKLMETLLSDAKPDKQALDNLIQDELKQRKDGKLSKGRIKSGLISYGTYGPKSSFTDILSEKELKEIKPEELIDIIKNINSYEHHIIFYGDKSPAELTKVLNENHNVPSKFKPIPAAVKYDEQPTTKNQVYVVDYDMKQVELTMLSHCEKYNKENIPVIRLFNEYFGSGMSSVVFQELRESKALAYTAFAFYSNPDNPDKSHYMKTFIGTQIDKLPEAMNGMNSLLNNMPESEKTFETCKEQILQQLRTERITKSSVLFSYENALKFGRDYDIRKDIFNKVQGFKFDDIKKFQEKYVKDNNYNILVLGNKKNLDIKTLEKYGEIKYLSLSDIFGY
ncbi:MAG: insulinase family protein [Bacteroidota bacterium]|nr:insulinase family protein [Bacteroidota bacterium]